MSVVVAFVSWPPVLSAPGPSVTEIVRNNSPVLNLKLISCLIEHESGWSNNKVGLHGEIGILQYLPSTFKYQCIDKYKIADKMEDIKLPYMQILCADQMLSDGLLGQWTTRIYCTANSD